jgi:galactokinase
VSDELIRASAPARVNIIGEHTDYNGGLVLPTNTAIFTRVTASPREDRVLQVRSSTIGETQSINLDDLRPGETGTWIEYVKGVAAGLQQAGIELRGAELFIDSDIPLGAGLSSSASLELSVAKALLGISAASISDADLALLCQQAEHDYAGVQCGIMDQYSLACAQYGKAVLLDCRSLQAQQVQLPAGIALILTDSGVRHSLSDGAYNNRAEECATAVALLAESVPGLESLRDLNPEILEANKANLNEVLYRRCRHVVTEIQRVQDTVEALGDNDLQKVGSMLNACHESLRDDYAVSCAELDALVECANSSDLILGSRMVGAGFGGCVLSVCRKHDAAAAAADIQKSYAAISGGRPWQHLVAPAQPAKVDNPE